MSLNFKTFERDFTRDRRFAIVAFIVNAVLGIGFDGLIIWVAAHFLKKYW